MNRRAQVKLLEKAGFTCKRIGTKHDVWVKDGYPQISLSKGKKPPAWRTLRSMKSICRKAMEDSHAITLTG